MSAITITKIERIQTLASELHALGQTALVKASEAGRLLMECKDGLSHGQWLPWLESNFTFTDRTARRWMKLADDLATGKIKSDTVSNLSEAYRITTEAKAPTEDSDPFEMPLPHQRLILLSDANGFAAFEPMDETYMHVSYTEKENGEVNSIAGAPRGIHKDYAWRYLIQHTNADWKKATPAYVPWTPTGICKNHNLFSEDSDFLEKFLGL